MWKIPSISLLKKPNFLSNTDGTIMIPWFSLRIWDFLVKNSSVKTILKFHLQEETSLQGTGLDITILSSAAKQRGIKRDFHLFCSWTETSVTCYMQVKRFMFIWILTRNRNPELILMTVDQQINHWIKYCITPCSKKLSIIRKEASNMRFSTWCLYSKYFHHFCSMNFKTKAQQKKGSLSFIRGPGTPLHLCNHSKSHIFSL